MKLFTILVVAMAIIRVRPASISKDDVEESDDKYEKNDLLPEFDFDSGDEDTFVSQFKKALDALKKEDGEIEARQTDDFEEDDDEDDPEEEEEEGDYERRRERRRRREGGNLEEKRERQNKYKRIFAVIKKLEEALKAKKYKAKKPKVSKSTTTTAPAVQVTTAPTPSTTTPTSAATTTTTVMAPTTAPGKVKIPKDVDEKTDERMDELFDLLKKYQDERNDQGGKEDERDRIEVQNERMDQGGNEDEKESDNEDIGNEQIKKNTDFMKKFMDMFDKDF